MNLAALPKAILSKENVAGLEKVRKKYDPGCRFHLALGLERDVGASV